MPLILLKQTYENRSIINQPALWFLRWQFDTTTQTDTYEEIGVITGGSQSNYAQYGNLPNFERQQGEEIWSVCGPTIADSARAPFTKTTWRYNTQPRGTTTPTPTLNATSCGFVPPVVLSCRIIVTRIEVVGSTATVITDEAAGVVEYVLLGQSSRPRQTSNVFANLAPGRYTVEAYDTGSRVPGCKATLQFTIEPQTTGLATLLPLPEICFAGNPVVVRAVASLAARPIFVRVYLETSQGSNNYSVVYEAIRPTDASGNMSIDVRDMLRSGLRSELDMTPGWHQLTRPIRRWYVAVAEVIQGKLGVLVTSAKKTVLLGGLPPEMLADGADFFSTAASAQRDFMTWQPGRKRVGPQHLEVVQMLHLNTDPPLLRVSHNQTAADTPPLVRVYFHPLIVVIGTGEEPEEPLAPVWLLSQFVLDIGVEAPVSSRLQLQVEFPGTGRVCPVNKVLDIDRDPLIDPRQFIFENSLAGFDTLAAFGQLSSKLNTEQQLVKRYAPVGEAVDVRDMSWPTTGNRPTYSVATGWLTPNWLEYLVEMFKPGRDVYEVVAGRIRPIALLNKELVIYQDNNSQPFSLIEYQSVWTSNFYADHARNTNRY